MSRRSDKYGAAMSFDGRNPFWKGTADVNALGVFTVDQITLDQWCAQNRREEPAGPERALWIAVLEDAIKNLRKYHGLPDPTSRALYHFERRWIEDDREHVGTFVYCCRLVHLEPAAVRAVLLRPMPTWGEHLNGHRVESAPKLLTRHAVGVSG